MSMRQLVAYSLLCALPAAMVFAGNDRSPVTAGQRLAYAAYVTGEGRDEVQAVALDKDGGIWVAGSTSSWREHTAPNWPYQANLQGGRDVFLAKYKTKPDGTAELLFWTYFGGAGDEEVRAMALDDVGRVYLVGSTTSNDFPKAGSGFQREVSGGSDAFLAIFDPRFEDRDSLYYTTLFGGAGAEVATALAVLKDGRVAVVGNSNSTEYSRVADGLQAIQRGSWDAFFFLVDPEKENSLLYATFFGGTSSDFAAGVGVDSKGNYWLAGYTSSVEDFPVTDGAYRTVASSNADLWVAKFDLRKPGLEALDYCTFIGGDGLDVAERMYVDGNDAIWLTGYTLSQDFPVTAGAYQSQPRGFGDAFLMKLDMSKPDIIAYSTLYGGVDGDVANALLVLPGGRAVIAGYSMSPDLPVTSNGVQVRPASEFPDAFVAVINTSVSGREALEYASYYGGIYIDVASAVAVDGVGNVWLGGYTTSNDLRTTDGSWKQSLPAIPAGFLIEISQ